MKVGTDGVLLGAWIGVDGVKRILDIGTGTGLVALMAAQRNQQAVIRAIDIDKHACEQAEENVTASPWPDRIKVFHSSLEEYALKSDEKYDLIVCNPPYFIDSKRSEDKKRRIARHADTLPLDDLFRYGFKLLTESGKFGIVFPYSDKDRVLETAEKYGLFPEKVLNVRHNIKKEFVRVLISFGKDKAGNVQETILIVETDVRHRYTKEFAVLVRDFYLYVD